MGGGIFNFSCSYRLELCAFVSPPFWTRNSCTSTGGLTKARFSRSGCDFNDSDTVQKGLVKKDWRKPELPGIGHRLKLQRNLRRGKFTPVYTARAKGGKRELFKSGG